MLGNSICVGLFLGSFGKDWYYYNIEFSNLWTWPISYKGKLYDSTTSLGNAGKSGREWPSSPFFLGLLRIPAGGCPALPYPPGRMRTCSLAWWGEWTCHREPPVFWPPFPLHCPNHCRCLVSSSLHRTSFIVSSHFSLDPPRRIFRVTQSKAFVVAFYLRCRTLSPAPFPANHFGEVLLTVPCDLTSPLGLALTFVLYTGVSQSKQEHLLYLESFLPIFMIQFFNKKNRSSRIVHIHIPIN